ncbi:response regulator transcription factor [Reichenbachiella versicolor]|uniref:response regulator transcription factor n=1 Tax=Reichenbachiella versicolor TaxID=1821036 RepID=UPI000D6E3032|nr:response regulator transcription factor [Reichenbachiella versicolor]
MKSQPKVLLVEDDVSLGFMIKDVLSNNDYDVRWIEDGHRAWDEFGGEGFDLCILDVMMPRMDGFTLSRRIRELDQNIPIIFLTARSMQEDKLRGFEMGGDDYLTKPFSVDELICRMEVFLRRNGTKTKSLDKYRIGHYELDSKRLTLAYGKSIRNLTRREADLLEMLIMGDGEIVNRSNILTKLWGEDDYFKGRSLDVFISRLRKYLREDRNILLENIHSVGFRLIVLR